MFLKITTVNSDQGLPNEQVHTARQDKFGRIWMATPAGLACYNGNSIKVYDTRSGLECLGLRTINITNDGMVWIGTDRGLEAINIYGTRIDLDIKFDWKYGIAESIFKSKGFLYVGTSFGLLKIKQTNEVLELEYADNIGLVSKIIQKDDNHFFVVSAKYGLLEYGGINWKLVNEHLPEADLITCIEKTIDNFYLVGSTNGLYVLNVAYEIVEHFFLSNLSKKITAITVLGDEWWVAFGHTIVLVKPTSTKIKVIEYEEVNSIINDLFIDNTNNVWIATNNAGLKKISILRKTIAKIDCGINNPAFSVKEINEKKNLLVGGDGFCSIITKEPVAIKNPVAILSTIPSIVWDTCIDPTNKNIIWLATVDGLYYSINQETAVRFKDKNNIINSPNRVLLTRENEIWLGTISGLFKIINNYVVEILTQDGEKFGYVYALALDGNNQILIGTLGQGLWKETESGIVHVTSKWLTEKGNTYAVVPNKTGDVLVIQEEKIILLDNKNNTRLISTEHPIAGWTCVWLNTNTVATGSNDGIIIIDTDTGIVQQRINLLLSKADWQFTSTRSIILDDNEKLYCCLNAGLFVIDYKNIQQFNVAPKVQLDDILWQNVSPQKNSIEYKIPTGNWSVNISVFAAWFTDEKQVRFRFKLVGFDENWTELSERPSIRYSSLPLGKYELQCQAYTALTGFGDTETIMLITIFSPWFIAGIAPFVSKMSIGFNTMFKAKHRNRLLLEKNKDLLIEVKERKMAEQALQRYKQQLEEIVENRTKELTYQKERAESADKMKSTFLSNMSHEIRTPLGIVIGMNNLLQKTNPNFVQLDYIEKIDSSAKHLLEVINDILDIAKIESGKIDIEQASFSMNDIIKNLESFAEINVGDKYVAFFIENDIKTTQKFIGDALRLKQVLLNLVSNAFKFTEKGKVILSIKQENISVEKVALTFSVKDNGIGMNDEQLRKVFNAFEQGDSSISKKYGGTGLGLNISYNFISLMGGELKVASEISKGTSFYFTIPLGISSEQDVSSATNLIKTGYKTIYPVGFENIKHAKILIAEDDILNQFIIKQILEIEGFNITIAKNGLECIDYYKKEKDFDLILMDVQMPEMDGLAASNYIRTKMKDEEIKIIGISANAFAETKEEAIQNGMNDFISKPINENELFSVLTKWINQKG
jgi:signal transduction histidine kinase/ligand-binding sensor domain-containing protein/ActR/RegA family two-component response regulator